MNYLRKARTVKAAHWDGNDAKPIVDILSDARSWAAVKSGRNDGSLDIRLNGHELRLFRNTWLVIEDDELFMHSVSDFKERFEVNDDS